MLAQRVVLAQSRDGARWAVVVVLQIINVLKEFKGAQDAVSVADIRLFLEVDEVDPIGKPASWRYGWRYGGLSCRRLGLCRWG